MNTREELFDFYKGKRVFLTGHTGFKGSWMCRILGILGSEVCGYSLEPPTFPSLYETAEIEKDILSVKGDVRDRESLERAMMDFRPDVAIHMAAQPLVRLSYDEPHMTYETNVMGTVNFLEAVRKTGSVRSVVNVTTDKVYFNREDSTGYVETDMLDGYDPYSNSKSCSDIITHSYRSSFFNGNPAVSTARAGNVIGGGDFAKDRLLPDCVRAASENKPVIIRNPEAVRPFQHVIEPLFAYLILAMEQYLDSSKEGAYNVGPDIINCLTVKDMVEHFCRSWGEGASYNVQGDGGPHEAKLLMLNCRKITEVLGWKPVWDAGQAVEMTIEWSKVWKMGEDVRRVMDRQIESYLSIISHD
ncbi:MAG: CDP-glucose 4,6-dehydratase [Lachnospiraceae bacterium]|jgi:CDP-glucose 4,6-dehydratase